jgi:hypothetical protein
VLSTKVCVFTRFFARYLRSNVGLDSKERSYTYTIITTDSNKQVSFLHDRMPVILDNGSEDVKTWLDPNRYEWTNELQNLLKPYEGELEIYPVNKDVGKVGNNSPSFIIPLNSAANKSNIANFFGNQKRIAKDAESKKNVIKVEEDVVTKGVRTERKPDEMCETTQEETTESNAPLPASPRGIKREHSDEQNDDVTSPHKKKLLISPRADGQTKLSPAKPTKKMKSATNNGSAGKGANPSKAAGTQKITNFFGK